MATVMNVENECGDAVRATGVRNVVGVTDGERSVVVAMSFVVSGENVTSASSSPLVPELVSKGNAPVKARKGKW
ncbi:DUF3516 domain-containing protein [Sesbania bispinosa]|nr:DUF3516 domain-containing protein [Sesbania bispinosa]